MESDMYTAALGISGRDARVIDEISQHSTSNPLVQCYSLDLNNQSHIINGISMLSVHAKVVNTTLVLLFYLAWCKQGWNALASFPCWFFL